MNRKPFLVLMLAFALLPESVFAWDATGHQLVGSIAWSNMTTVARKNVADLLRAAPQDACLLDLFPQDARPLEERERELFIRATTWSDIVRPRGQQDPRPCVRFHRSNWHFINLFWEGLSGDPNDPPRDRRDLTTPEVNAIERLKLFRPFAACGTRPCGTPLEERATTLAWILHLVGDIHQPLHTSARVTSEPDEREGDRGGNQFKLGPNDDSPSLHGFWDGIVTSSVPRQPGESEMAYLSRVAADIVANHPPSQMSGRLQSGNFEAWSKEGFEITKREVYPRSLQRRQMPSAEYRGKALTTSKDAIALGGYRLADLLNQMFGF